MDGPDYWMDGPIRYEIFKVNDDPLLCSRLPKSGNDD